MIPKDLQKLMIQCWNNDPSKRPVAEDILAFIKKVDISDRIDNSAYFYEHKTSKYISKLLPDLTDLKELSKMHSSRPITNLRKDFRSCNFIKDYNDSFEAEYLDK